MTAEQQPPGDGRIARLAAEFWTAAGGPAVLPRDREPLLPLALPVSVVLLAGLSCARIQAWAAGRGLPAPETGPDRPLRGCLLAYSGEAFLLLDPSDPAADRRFTAAHELGHFLIEVREPRQRAERALGPSGLAVLDGERPPSTEERLDAVLAGVSLAPHVHLMTRDEDGTLGCARVAAAECAADRFALELLAPAATLRAEVLALASQPIQQRWALVTAMLTERYGLPVIPAGGYAKELVRALTGGETVRAWLGAE